MIDNCIYFIITIIHNHSTLMSVVTSASHQASVSHQGSYRRFNSLSSGRSLIEVTNPSVCLSVRHKNDTLNTHTCARTHTHTRVLT